MANRYLKQFQYAFEQDTVTIYGSISVGASGAVSDVKGGGVRGAVKETTAGQYTIELEDKYNRVLRLDADVILATISPVAKIQLLESPATIQADFKADKKLTIQCVDYAGAAVNPASGAEISFRILLRNSSVGPFDN